MTSSGNRVIAYCLVFKFSNRHFEKISKPSTQNVTVLFLGVPEASLGELKELISEDGLELMKRRKEENFCNKGVMACAKDIYGIKRRLIHQENKA